MSKKRKIFPVERYKIEVEGNTVRAVSSFAGKPVVGVAKCNPEDEFSEKIGKELAIARCNYKVCEKRYKRAVKKHTENLEKMKQLLARDVKHSAYLEDATRDLHEAKGVLTTLDHML